MPGSGRRRLLAGIGTVIAILIVLWFATRLAGSWMAVGACLRQVGPLDLALLTFVWAAGLFCHSWVLTAALPGLSRPRAMLINVSGSAVSDLIPFGGAAGAGVTLAMLRSWNFSTSRYASFTMISNLWNVTAKLALPAGVLGLAIAEGTITSPGLVIAAESALVATAVLATLGVVALADARFARLLGRTADRVLARRARSGAVPGAPVSPDAPGSPATTSLAHRIPALRSDTALVIRRGWRQLTAGVVGYIMLQGLLWFLCLRAVGATPALTAGLVGFAVERVLSTLPFTPGGAGLAEAGSIAALVSLGGDPVVTAAGVILYRGFAFLIEIPVGGSGLLIWMWFQRQVIRPSAGESA